METIRDIVFIGHATPEDNEFTLWLQAKLNNEGYHCECDLSFLLGGEKDFWGSIQSMLEESTKKYILVLSRSTFNKEGVKDEWEYCKSLERRLGLRDFIIPVRIDDVPYDTRIGLNRMNVISFQQWGVGLKKLIRKLDADGVPKRETNALSLTDWYENVYTNHSGVDKKSRELFYSNWLPIDTLPAELYLYRFDNADQAEELLKHNTHFPTVRHGNYLASFSKPLTTWLPDKQFDIAPREIMTLETAHLSGSFDSDGFPNYVDFRNLITRLLRAAFDGYLERLGLDVYEYSSHTKCYFFPRVNDEAAKGVFELNGKKKNIGVHGNHLNSCWHFGVSFSPLITPALCFSLRTHIVFTEDGQTPIKDKNKQHSLRRAKGKRMYNNAWRDQVLAFTARLGAEANPSYFELAVSHESVVRVHTTPITFEAPFGYTEPNDENRLAPSDDFFEDEEFYNDMENELLKDA